MLLFTHIILALYSVAFVTAAPTTSATLQSLNFPDEFVSIFSKRETTPPDDCPGSVNSCGVITFKNGHYSTFSQGKCMQLDRGVQSIYVAKCYCSLWNTCTGQAGKDVFVEGMMMCDKPRSVDTFDKEVKYISCGGLN